MKTLIIGDTHFPFQNRHAAEWVVNVARELKPDKIVQIGDLYDFYAFSKYTRTVTKIMSASDELVTGRKDAMNFFSALRAAAGKKCRIAVLRGNHDVRPLLRIKEKLPEAEDIVEDWLTKRLTFPGVEIWENERIEDGVMYMHGFRKFGEHAPYNQMNTVCGHLHIGGTKFFTNRNGTYWELNAGWVGDKTYPAFSYYEQKRIHPTTLGAGWIDSYGPRFLVY